MTNVDLEVVKLRKELDVKKWNKIDKVINRGTLVALWIILAFVVGLSIGVFLGG